MERDHRMGRAASMKIRASGFTDSSFHEKIYCLLAKLEKMKDAMRRMPGKLGRDAWHNHCWLERVP